MEPLWWTCQRRMVRPRRPQQLSLQPRQLALQQHPSVGASELPRFRPNACRLQLLGPDQRSFRADFLDSTYVAAIMLMQVHHVGGRAPLSVPDDSPARLLAV